MTQAAGILMQEKPVTIDNKAFIIKKQSII
jgi:hypothetical protein